MSATVSAFGHRGTTSSVKTEIVRELVNASDGAGLHFNGSGVVAFTPVDLGSKFSHEFVLSASEDLTTGTSSYIIDYHRSSGDPVTTDRFIIGFNPSEDSGNLAIYDNTGWESFGVNPLTDLKVHHIVVTVDGTSAVLYDNGNQVATATISSSHGIDGTTNAGLAGYYNNSNNFEGTIYRARSYNKTLEPDEVRAAYERADVDFADQYGEQNLVDAAASAFTSGTYSWVAYGTNAIANVSNNLTITYGNNEQGAYNYLRDSSDLNQDLVVGKKYRLRITAKYTGGSSGVQFELNNGATLDSLGALTTSFAEYVHEFTAGSGAASAYLRLDGLATGNVVTIDTWQVDEIGCVSDYELSANPTQSRTIQDRAGAADGTASSSGVTQVQPIIQGNLTSLAVTTSQKAAGVPADGVIIADKLGIGIAPSHAATIYGTGAGNATVQIEGEGGADPTINFLTNNTTHWAVGVDDSDSDKFKIVQHSAIGTTNNFFTISSTGLATFNNGIAFSQTNSTAASNITTTLDHYERGVWTPVIADAATGGNTGSGSTVTGYYERIGNAVTVNGLATNVDTTGLTGTNVLFVRGLPFPAGYSSGTFSNLGRAVGSCVLDSVDVDTSTRSVSAMVTGQNSYFTFHQTRDAVGDSNILVSNLSSGTSDLFFSFTYFVD
jgi:hypothetical protein